LKLFKSKADSSKVHWNTETVIFRFSMFLRYYCAILKTQELFPRTFFSIYIYIYIYIYPSLRTENTDIYEKRNMFRSFYICKSLHVGLF